MELSVIVEREQDVPKSKPNELDLENSADSGLASTSGNSLDTGKNDVIKRRSACQAVSKYLDKTFLFVEWVINLN